MLIEKGAKVVTSGKDIVDELGLTSHALQKQTKKYEKLTKEEKKIVVLLQDQTVHVDELAKQMNLPVAKVGMLLSLMGIKGLIKSLDAGFFA